MPNFMCGKCHETIKKPKVKGHLEYCRTSTMDCIDCRKTFTTTTVHAHTSCMTEGERYAGNWIKKRAELAPDVPDDFVFDTVGKSTQAVVWPVVQQYLNDAGKFELASQVHKLASPVNAFDVLKRPPRGGHAERILERALLGATSPPASRPESADARSSSTSGTASSKSSRAPSSRSTRSAASSDPSRRSPSSRSASSVSSSASSRVPSASSSTPPRASPAKSPKTNESDDGEERKVCSEGSSSPPSSVNSSVSEERFEGDLARMSLELPQVGGEDLEAIGGGVVQPQKRDRGHWDRDERFSGGRGGRGRGRRDGGGYGRGSFGVGGRGRGGGRFDRSQNRRM